MSGLRIPGHLGDDDGTFKNQGQLIGKTIWLFGGGLDAKRLDIITDQLLELFADIPNGGVLLGILTDGVDKHVSEKIALREPCFGHIADTDVDFPLVNTEKVASAD